jgi:hypothetical protein
MMNEDDEEIEFDAENTFEKGQPKPIPKEIIRSEEIFPNYRPIKNANRRAVIIAEANAKALVQEMDKQKEISAQRLSKLFCAGTDSKMIYHDIKRRRQAEKRHTSKLPTSQFEIDPTPPLGKISREMETQERIMSTTISLKHSTAAKFKSPRAVQSSVIYNNYSHRDWKSTVGSKVLPVHSNVVPTSAALYLADRAPG